jgi:hypothetical protein
MEIPKSPVLPVRLNGYHNILASATIDFQIATQAFRARWREPTGTERNKVWAFMVDCYPFYADTHPTCHSARHDEGERAPAGIQRS